MTFLCTSRLRIGFSNRQLSATCDLAEIVPPRKLFEGISLIPPGRVIVQRLSKKAVFSPLNGLIAVLAGLFVLELYFALRPFDYPPPAVPAIVQPSDFGGPPQSVVSAWGAVVLARPLFNPSRRPPAAGLAREVEIPRLSGIMITPSEKIAVFSPAAGSPIIVVKNSRMGAFTVMSITSDSVTVKGPEGVIVLRSDFSHREQFEKSTPGDVILPGGIDLNDINVPLPSASNWIGPPAAN